MSAPEGSDRANYAYEKLRELIVTGRLAPGSRVTETDIAARLGVSRTPIRSALQRLRREGYVLSDPEAGRSRPVVAPLTESDARELFYVVGEIEGMAAALCADLAGPERASLTDELAEINEVYSERAELDQPDFNRLFQLDTRFHRTYVEAGAGPRLQELHSSMKPQAERYIRVYIRMLTDEIPVSVREHGDIVAAIAAGEADAAERAVQANWRNATGRLGEVIEDLGERGSW